MARFLFVSAPLVGHVLPLRPYAGELARRGHEVAWAVQAGLVGHLVPAGQRVYGLPEDSARRAKDERRADAGTRRAQAALALAAFERHLVPLAESSLAGVEAAVDAFEPDALVVDMAALAGALVARRRALPWATATDTHGAAEAAVPAPVASFVRERLEPLQRAAGLAPVDRPHLSPHLVLVRSVRELAADASREPHVRLVGATPDLETPFGAVPWELLRDDVPIVAATLGTTVAERGERFLSALCEALAEEPVQIAVAAPPELVPAPPANAVVRHALPLGELLTRASALVCHCGHSTMLDALLQGRPLVAAPVAYDQPYNASRVVAAGAALRVRFARPRPAEIRDGVRRVLGEPSFRDAAARIGAALRAAGGAVAAADALEQLVGARAAAHARRPVPAR